METYRNKFNFKYDFEINQSHSLAEISKLTNLKLSSLQEIYNKGIGAYKTNPESVRPNVKSKEQWAMARVYSAVMGGKASIVDKNELIEGKMKNGGLIAPKKTEKMEEIDVFYNPDIYVEEKDYIIGGFTIGELKGIRVVGDNSELGETKLYRVFKDRIISHIEEFKTLIKGDTIAYPKSDRINDNLNNIFESIDIHLNSNNIEGDGTYDNEYLADEIMQHPAYVLWRSRITNRVNNNYRTAVPIPLISDKPNKISSEDAEELTKNVTLHHILEQLSNIIENEDEQ
jgi:hypothetical protein